MGSWLEVPSEVVVMTLCKSDPRKVERVDGILTK
eukprot:SAG11_NODE_10552_length_822_cov_1.547718_1_plen_33_part_10